MFGRRRKAVETLIGHAAEIASGPQATPQANWLTFGVELETALIVRDVRSVDELDLIFAPFDKMEDGPRDELGQLLAYELSIRAQLLAESGARFPRDEKVPVELRQGVRARVDRLRAGS